MGTFEGMWAAVQELAGSPLVIVLTAAGVGYGLLSWRFRWSAYGRSTRIEADKTHRGGSDDIGPRLHLVHPPADHDTATGDSRPPYDWQYQGL